MPDSDRRGVLFFIVLGILIVVAILSTVILRIMLSQSRLTHHQVSRIQAQYAARAGLVYALEMLKKGTADGGWGYSVLPAVNSCPNSSGCLVTDAAFPASINSVKVIFCPSGSICESVSQTCIPPAGCNFCINSTAVFTPTL